MSLIQTLITAGELVLWHHYSRHAVDLSGNGNHGTHSATTFTGDGVQFSDPASVITVADSAELQITGGTIIYHSDLMYDAASFAERLVSKADAGGLNYELRLDSTPKVELVDSSGTRFLNTSLAGKCCLGVNFADGTLGEVFADGSSIGNFSSNSVVATDDAPLKIGNLYVTTRETRSNCRDVAIINRKLTAPEHAEIFAELREMHKKFDTHPHSIVNRGAADQLFKTNRGVYESVANKTSGYLENTGFRVESGTFKVVHEEISGRLEPVIECVANGTLSFAGELMQQTSAQQAYGTWEFWVNHDNAASTFIGFATPTADFSAGYGITIASDETVKIVEYGGGDVTATGGTLTAGQWTKIKVTRTGGNLFTLIIDDVTADTGTDPTTSATNYIMVSMDAGDKFGPFYKQI